MKTKLILFFIIIFSATILKAQTQKGDQLIGGSIGFNTGTGSGDNVTNSYQNNYTSKTVSLSIGPSYSYFIADKLDLGVSLGYTNQKITYNYLPVPVYPYTENTSNRSHAFTAGVYLRKYFLFDNKIGIRTGPFVSYQKNRADNYYTDASQNYFYDDYSYNAGVIMELVFFPIKKLGIATNIASLSYSHDDNKQTSNQVSSNSFGFNVVGNGLSLSILYSLGK